MAKSGGWSKDQVPDLLADILLSLIDFFYCLCYFIKRGALGHKAPGTELQHMAGIGRVVIYGDANDPDGGIIFQNLLGHLKTIYGLHVDVHQHHIRFQAAGVINCVLAIACFMDNGKAFIMSKQQAPGLTSQLMIIHQDDTDRVFTHVQVLFLQFGKPVEPPRYIHQTTGEINVIVSWLNKQELLNTVQ